MSSEKRFITTESEGSISGTKVIIDTETGVNYLFCKEGYAGGLTPLLDSDGKPVVSRKNDDL